MKGYQMRQENKSSLVIQVDTPFLTVGELSLRTGLSDSTIRRLIRSGFINVSKGEGVKTSVLINMVDLNTRAAAASTTVQELLKNRARG